MAGEAIFIGYRRDDTADVAGRIYDAMTLRFGKGRVFKDVDNIGPGIEFGDYIKTVLARCRVALILIGPHWLTSKDETGNRRLDDDNDWVRMEIKTALATPGVLVVPVLVNGAGLPPDKEMPDSLKPLLGRNAAIIRRDPDFHDDVERLATAIRSSVSTGFLDLSKIGGKATARTPLTRLRDTRATLLIGTACVVLALLAVGFGVSRLSPMPNAERVEHQTAKVEPSPQDAQPVETESAQVPTPQAPLQETSASAPPAPSRVVNSQPTSIRYRTQDYDREAGAGWAGEFRFTGSRWVEYATDRSDARVWTELSRTNGRIDLADGNARISIYVDRGVIEYTDPGHEGYPDMVPIYRITASN